MHREFNDRFTKLEKLNQIQVPTAASAPKPKQRRKLKRVTVHPRRAVEGKNHVRSNRSLQPLPTLSEGENSLMENRLFR
ncbi:hypothetical protein TNCT_692571 [Trichonephila clavata]|uniref:Uncharacterized protein n=1 Tax=Trichonephila clavata TaxID=2740835 RepID=A0A8X6ID38_TRICU|nr:hypothetical protein TNCT_692571 [Trichonephila clavata]